MIMPMQEELDPGIKATVELLQSEGFDTCDSGDGVSKDPEDRAMDVPHVFVAATRYDMLFEADRMLGVLDESWTIEASYNPSDRHATILAYRMSEND